MDENMIGRCGTYCGDCEWVTSTGCKGCQANAGVQFWGVCKIAVCSIEKGHHHCGTCKELPCTQLIEAFNTPGHEDHGERLDNLKNWGNGVETFIRIGSYKK